MFFPTKKLAHRMRIVFGLLGLSATELHGNLSMIQVWCCIVSPERGGGGYYGFLNVVVGVVKCFEALASHLCFLVKYELVLFNRIALCFPCGQLCIQLILHMRCTWHCQCLIHTSINAAY